jgi:hypothetical protein
MTQEEIYAAQVYADETLPALAETAAKLLSAVKILGAYHGRKLNHAQHGRYERLSMTLTELLQVAQCQ